MLLGTRAVFIVVTNSLEYNEFPGPQALALATIISRFRSCALRLYFSQQLHTQSFKLCLAKEALSRDLEKHFCLIKCWRITLLFYLYRYISTFRKEGRERPHRTISNVQYEICGPIN